MSKNLVIVESPTKAKTIGKFLGNEYTVCSSKGHIRDLSKKELGINLNNKYEPEYIIPAEKKKIVAELKEAAKKAENIWLASDEDREGEAIAWHLTQVLNLPVETTKRIVFHEITSSAIHEAIENPKTINCHLVDAQQARRVLDRLVGFELSPVLWRKVRPSLSAGRVQSVAVRLIVEKEREIISFKPKTYYRVIALFYPKGTSASNAFKAEYSKRLENKEDAYALLERLRNSNFIVSDIETKPTKRNPAPPFTTSTLQQDAGRKFGMSVSQTMQTAQSLYEKGLITYMRTDSVNLSSLAINTAKEQINKMFGEQYSSPRRYTTHSKGAQEAHEAIRPSYLSNETITGSASEQKLYSLIWKRTMASQMAAAQIDRTTIIIKPSNDDNCFIAVGDTVVFDGFLKLYQESTDSTEESSEDVVLPKINTGESLIYKEIVASEKHTSPASRYNEPTLVKKLEELGIGRPSTFAPTITTIIKRGYVDKTSKPAQKRKITELVLTKEIQEKQKDESYGAEKNRLFPTDIGIIVNDYLETHFCNIIDYNFTAQVEEQFDDIVNGKIKWYKMIDDFYHPFHNAVENAINTQEKRDQQVRVIGIDPKSGHEVKARIGKYGPMVEISGEGEEKPKFAALKKGQLIETITLEEALNLFALPRVLGEFEGNDVVIGIGRYGGYIRHNNKEFTSLPKTEDPYTITIDKAISLIEAQRQAKQKASMPARSFPEDPSIEIKHGRYGMYIACNGKNYRIPKDKKGESLTLEECRKIITNSKK
ncbi:MAG: type I DNA topoisomerase [Alistipes sp.]|nr:type I DNA topoisomerase [Candidatus Alistipes equi]